jgi:geranylgeranyl diphosphate synthase type II
MQPGKRVRPRMVLLGAELFGTPPEKVLPIAAAFEMLHNFTLIHDDIMDNAPLRRGKETVFKKWNSNIAILSGDALATMALEQILQTELPAKNKLEIVTLFARTSIEICEGQQYDLNFETKEQVTIEEYMEMIRLKTAVMLAGCLKAGAIAANAPRSDREILYNIGISLGFAFQLKDDLLDLYADQQSLGKQIGMDIADHKKTYLLLRALQEAQANDRDKLLQLFAPENSLSLEEKLPQIIEIYRKCHVRDKTEVAIENCLNEALSLIETLSCPENKKNSLREIATLFRDREK